MPRSRSLKRRASVREAKRKFILYTEGQKTEPAYFEALRRRLAGALVDIEIVGAAGVPLTIAKSAIDDAKKRFRRGKRRSSFEEADEVWAVFDRDAHPNVAEALTRCRDAKVGTAFSDPCFELWLILHHVDFDRPDDRHAVQKECEKHCAGYDAKSGKTADCDALIAHVQAAEDRAERQYARRQEEGDPPARPYTTVYELTRKIRDAHDLAKP